MTNEQVGLAAAGAVALVALVVALLAHRRARRAESLVSSLAERVALPSTPAAQSPPVADSGTTAFVITQVGAEEQPDPVPAVPVAQPIDGRLFTDIVARETVVKAAGWTHGLRRALSPETRNRIRFAVRQETKAAGRERRAEMKQALREFRARERAAVREDVA
ncbi:hypothetical protein [Nocardioides sp. zg-1230]|uniref:hypothetical protein n=1 Tax=Nocardioides sp. zg-1230 TaxID=2736601 RepID=UPI001556787E|nr:hypothetical protein [Nocardioides sp. zg-1230]NPC43741.1 hypothetical protein [Nocardioides sp. zg-1230]